MNKGIIALLTWYNDKGVSIAAIINDCNTDTLTANTTRDGRSVYWYYAGGLEYCVDTDGHELSQDEIEQQLQ